MQWVVGLFALSVMAVEKEAAVFVRKCACFIRRSWLNLKKCKARGLRQLTRFDGQGRPSIGERHLHGHCSPAAQPITALRQRHDSTSRAQDPVTEARGDYPVGLQRELERWRVVEHESEACRGSDRQPLSCVTPLVSNTKRPAVFLLDHRKLERKAHRVHRERRV